MNASELLRSLQEEGVQLWREGDELRYRAPKGSLSVGIIEALAARKQEIIQLLQNHSVARPCFQARRPLPSDSQEVYPLSFAQQRMWFLQQLEPDSCALNVALGFSLNGPLDVPALERGLGELIKRHEAFRTMCAVNDVQPIQIIVPAERTSMPLEIVDLRTIPEPKRERELQSLIALEARRPFALDRSPLLHATLFQLAEDRYALLLTTHHFVVDGWSVNVMLRDLSALYDVNSNGRSSSLETLTSRYCDYAKWQRERLNGQMLEELLGYWKGKLAGAAELNLPTDRPVSGSPSGRGATHRFNLPSDLSQALKLLSRREGVTLFTTLLAAFKTLLHRYSGQNDITVGTAVSDRCMAETQTVVGCFANTLVLRTQCNDNPTFRQLLRLVHGNVIEAWDHQDMPFEVLVEQLRPERLHLRNPLFQVSFVLHQRGDDQGLKLDGLEVQRLPIDFGMTRFDLLLEFRNQEEQLSGLLEYSTDLFQATTIERMARHFEILLEGIVNHPDIRIGQLSLLTKDETEQIVVNWNRTAAPYPADRCVHEEFEWLARLRPEALAIAGEGASLNYRELNERSDRLADYLRSQGIVAGSRVALCVDRSIEMIIGMLGILKAGGAYVPLDPAYPAERQAFILNDVVTPVILTIPEAATSLPAFNAKVIYLDGEWSLIGGDKARTSSTENARPEVTSRDPAYVIFTSGSTGTPKGVVVSHRAIMRLVLNTNYVELGPQDRIAHLSHVCFDAATFEIWGALLTGGCIVLIPKSVALDPHRLGAELKRGKVTTVFLTTALFNEMAAEDAGIFQGVEQVLFGGEAVNPRSVRQVLESGGAPRRLLHVYGPTECTTFATFYPVTHVEENATTVPIGRPISNTTAYVLDKYGNPLPAGVPGELYLGGAGVAEGYLNQPELTRERFVSERFGGDQAERLYRTGDIVKYLPDGNIEFIGRADSQTKIRGFRIEPGEIEAVLKAHPEVENAVVVAREEKTGQRQLVGYVVTRDENILSSWRTYLEEKLPFYMIPSRIVRVEELPTTPSGKIDRLALPKPERQIQHDSAALSPFEEMTASVWSEVLEVEAIAPHESFFELGGHSLLATRVVSQLRSRFGVEIPLRAVFDHPTLAEMGRFIARSREEESNRSEPPKDVFREEALL